MNEVPGEESRHENIPDVTIDLGAIETPEPVEPNEPAEQPAEATEFEEMAAELSFNGRKTTRELLGFLAVHAKDDGEVSTADLARVLDPDSSDTSKSYPSARRSVSWMMDNDLVRYGSPKEAKKVAAGGKPGDSLVATDRAREIVDGDGSLSLKRDFYQFGKEQGLTDPNEIQRQLLDIAKNRQE